MERRTNLKKRTDGVSPVVGVMLMLVVTIIIAAVVATFAGGLVTTQEKTPTMVAEITITHALDNLATHASLGKASFQLEVESVSKPIDTKNLKLVTSWSTTNKTDGTPISGGAISLPGVLSATSGDGDGLTPTYVAPLGYGVGINASTSSGNYSNAPQMHFGNYTLTSGSGMKSSGYYINAAGTGPAKTDALAAVLGENYQNLAAGDQVFVQLIYIPTGSPVYSEMVTVR